MPLTRVIAEVNGENATFEGVALVDFCNKTGAMWDTETIKVISTDGAKCCFEHFSSMEQHRVSLLSKKATA